MTSDEDVLEYENDQAKLLPDSNEQTQRLHDDLTRFILPSSDNEGYQNEQLSIREQEEIALNHAGHGDVNRNDNASFRSRISKSNVWSVFPKRFIVLVLLALGSFNMYCVRMCLNVTIVAMTGEKDTSSSTEPEFQWSKGFQGTILASLYWGYTATQIPAGLLSFKFGGTFLFGFAIFGSSVLTLATPFIVRQNVHAFIVLRVFEGLLLGLVAASGTLIVSKWSPIYERSIFQTVGYSGLLAGTVFANSVSGVLASSSWGWPSVFYFFGVLGIVWYILWIYLVYEEPSNHPNITEAELKIIGKHWDSKLSFKQIPWSYILTSLPIWSLIIVNFTDCWCFYTFMLSFPRYLKDVLKFDVTKVGFISSLPYVLCAIVAPTWGLIVDILRRKKYISTTAARKLSVFLGMGVSSAFIIGVVFARTSTSVMAMVTVAISLTAISGSGPCVNVVEIAPKYAGVLMGIVNCACNISGFISPEVVGVLTEGGDPAYQWGLVFYITAGIEIFGMIVYLCFASADKQAWADD